MAEHDDDDDDPEFPAVVRAAGLIWLGIGGLGVLGGLAAPAAMVAGVLHITCFFWVLAAMMPVWVAAGLRGLRVAQGAIPDIDVIVDGFRSIAGGVSLLILGLVGLVVVGPLLGPGRWEEAVLAGGSSLGLGVLLILAGSLALSGRARYEAWWRINHPAPDHPPDEETDGPGG